MMTRTKERKRAKTMACKFIGRTLLACSQTSRRCPSNVFIKCLKCLLSARLPVVIPSAHCNNSNSFSIQKSNNSCSLSPPECTDCLNPKILSIDTQNTFSLR